MAFFTQRSWKPVVKVSETDGEAGYLIDKLLAGTGITITKEVIDGVEYLRFDATGGGGGADIEQVDISDQFDGSETTFTLPEYSSIVLVVVTGWYPNGALRPGVDFITPTDTTIELAGDLSAPVSGSRGIILYKPA